MDKLFCIILFIFIFLTPYCLNGNIICMLDKFCGFCFMLYSELLNNFYFCFFIILFITIILIILTLMMSQLQQKFIVVDKRSFVENRKYKLLKTFYKKNKEFFTIKNYYFFHLDKSHIFV